MITRPENPDKIYKEEVVRMIMPLNANSDIYNHEKYEVKIDQPDEKDERLVLIRYKEKQS